MFCLKIRYINLRMNSMYRVQHNILYYTLNFFKGMVLQKGMAITLCLLRYGNNILVRIYMLSISMIVKITSSYTLNSSIENSYSQTH